MMYAIYFWLTYLVAICIMCFAMVKIHIKGGTNTTPTGLFLVTAIALCPILNLFVSSALIYEWLGFKKSKDRL